MLKCHPHWNLCYAVNFRGTIHWILSVAITVRTVFQWHTPIHIFKHTHSKRAHGIRVQHQHNSNNHHSNQPLSLLNQVQIHIKPIMEVMSTKSPADEALSQQLFKYYFGKWRGEARRGEAKRQGEWHNDNTTNLAFTWQTVDCSRPECWLHCSIE